MTEIRELQGKYLEIVINLLHMFVVVEKHISKMKKNKDMKKTTSEDEKETLN